MGDLADQGYIPLDKSWMNRMGVLDLLHSYNDTLWFLENQKGLGKDLQALYQASKDWKAGIPQIHVGESGTLYRFLRFASWKMNKRVEFVKEGTLAGRELCDNPEIVGWSLEKLLTLDNNTSQWASASVLSSGDYGQITNLQNPPNKLLVTGEAVRHWNIRRGEGRCWEPKYDDTIEAQAQSYLNLLNGKMEFHPQQAEDYCYAVAFGFLLKSEGEKMWPSLKGHESNRPEAMQTSLEFHYFPHKKREETLESDDHRVVQAMAMLYQSQHRDATTEEIRNQFSNPDCVDKSWVQFWKFLEDAMKLK